MDVTYITFCCTDTKPEPWLSGLRAAIPRALVDVWQPGAPRADYAVVWSPPQQFIDEQTRLKAMFNIGAGVDGLLKLKLPTDLAVVRLDDAGMSAQMAEYVCHALIRHFREFDGYEADVAEGKWSYRKPRSRADFPVGILGLGVLGQRVAKAVAQFDFPVRGWSRTPHQIPGVTTFAGESEFNDFLAGTRVLVNLLPLTPQTENILRRDTLQRLLPGGYLINVARGAHLVDEDLMALLDEGHLAGAEGGQLLLQPNAVAEGCHQQQHQDSVENDAGHVSASPWPISNVSPLTGRPRARAAVNKRSTWAGEKAMLSQNTSTASARRSRPSRAIPSARSPRASIRASGSTAGRCRTAAISIRRT